MVFSSTLQKGGGGNCDYTRLKLSNLPQNFQSQKHLSRTLILSCLNCQGFKENWQKTTYKGSLVFYKLVNNFWITLSITFFQI